MFSKTVHFVIIETNKLTKTIYTVKRSRRFYGKYWQCKCTVHYTGVCRLFTGVMITYIRAVLGKVGNVQDIVGICAFAPCLKLTHLYPSYEKGRVGQGR